MEAAATQPLPTPHPTPSPPHSQWPLNSNWDGSVAFAPSAGYLTPHSVEDIVAFLTQHPDAKVKVVGAGHSWSAIAAPVEYLMTLDGMKASVAVDTVAHTVTVQVRDLFLFCAMRHNAAQEVMFY